MIHQHSMTHSFGYTITWIIISIIAVVLMTTRYKLPPFFALLLACFVLSAGLQFSPAVALAAVQQGFGDVLKSLGLVVILGTTLGAVLQHTGSTAVMSRYLLEKVGGKRAGVAVNLTGFIVGMPMFCGAGFSVLQGLNGPIAAKTKTSMVLLSASLATSLLSVHCLLPPHPGAAAATGIIGANIGTVILLGLPVAFCAMLAAYAWIIYSSKKFSGGDVKDETPEEILNTKLPAWKAFLPVLTPVVLIAAGAFLSNVSQPTSFLTNLIQTISHPVVALTIGVALAILAKREWNKKILGDVLLDGTEKAGGTLIIIGAGGSFGAVIAAANLSQGINDSVALGSLGLLAPFLISAFLKTAQGSSTVAAIAAAAIVQPLLPTLHLTTPEQKTLCVLALGAGSMTVSHANDAYFWLVEKLSGLETKVMLSVYSIATAVMGVTAFIVIYLLSLFLPH